MAHSKNHFDVVIVGNGVIASSVAMEVARKGGAVCVVAPRGRPGGASVAAGAMLVAFSELEPDTLACSAGRSKFQMSLNALKLWPQWAEHVATMSGKNLSIRQGLDLISNSAATALDDVAFDAVLKELRERGEAHELFDPSTLKGLNPAPEARPHRGVRIHGEGSLNPLALMDCLDAALLRGGVITVDAAATAVTVGDGALKTVHTAAGALTANRVVIAAGAESQGLIDGIREIRHRIQRIFYGVGAAMRLRLSHEAPERVVRSVNRGFACGIHVVPHAQDFVYAGASNFVSPVPEFHVRMTSMYQLMQAAMEQIHATFYKARVEQVAVGFRPTTADTFPLLGETSVEGLWVLTGTKRDGIVMSPWIAREYAAEIAGEGRVKEHPFQPERAIIRTMGKADAIEKTVNHMLSNAVQHELKMPKSGWEPLFRDALRRNVEEAYEKGGVADYGIPAEILEMYRYGHVRQPEI